MVLLFEEIEIQNRGCGESFTWFAIFFLLNRKFQILRAANQWDNVNPDGSLFSHTNDSALRPRNFCLGPVEKSNRITYSTASLTELGKTDRLPPINNILMLRLQNLALWNTAFNQYVSPIPVISTQLFKTNSSLLRSRFLRSYNCNNYVVFSPGEYATNQRNNLAMVQRSAMIPVRITQRPQAPHENKYLHVRSYDNFRKCNKTATPRNCIQIKLDALIDD